MDFTHEELKILQEAIDHYGEENQLDMAIEEMSELTNLRELKRLLDKLDRDEIEYRAYMRISEAMKDD